MSSLHVWTGVSVLWKQNQINCRYIKQWRVKNQKRTHFCYFVLCYFRWTPLWVCHCSTVSIRYSSVLGMLFQERNVAETSIIVIHQSVHHSVTSFNRVSNRSRAAMLECHFELCVIRERLNVHAMLATTIYLKQQDAHPQFHDFSLLDTWNYITTNKLILFLTRNSALCIITNFTMSLNGSFDYIVCTYMHVPKTLVT